MTERRRDLELHETLAEMYLEPMPAYRDELLARTAQARQRPVWISSERWPRMPILARRTSLAVAAVIAVALVVGGGILVSNLAIAPLVGAPSDLPSAPISLPSGAPLPADLVSAPWAGPDRAIPQLSSSPRTRLEMFPSRLDVRGDLYGAGVLDSGAAVVGPHTFRVSLIEAEAGCSVGDSGLYDWSLSAGKTRLTITPAGADACGARTVGISGTWLRDGCTVSADGCFGDLEAGTYPTQFIAPRLDPGAKWWPAFGAVTYTVPAGWANSAESGVSLTLTRSADYAKETPSGPPADVFNGIVLETQPAAMTQNAACSNDVNASVPRTLAGLVAYVRGLSTLTSGAPTNTTVDGYAATWVDVRAAPDLTRTCPGSTVPTAVFLANSPDGSLWSLGLAGSERERLVFVDLGSGDVVLIVVDSTDPARFDELVAQAMPIIGSMHFN